MNAPLDRTRLTSTLFIEGFTRVALVSYEFSVESQKNFLPIIWYFLKPTQNLGRCEICPGICLPSKYQIPSSRIFIRIFDWQEIRQQDIKDIIVKMSHIWVVTKKRNEPKPAETSPSHTKPAETSPSHPETSRNQSFPP